MGDPTAPPLQLERLLHTLADHDVEFVLVGGSAAGLAYDATRLTTDVDVCVGWSPENRERVLAALSSLKAGLRVDGLNEPLAVPMDNDQLLARMEVSTWRTSAGDLDVLSGIPVRGFGDQARYEELLGRAETVVLQGVNINVASLDDLIASKRAVNRQPDRDALPELEALAERRAHKASTAAPVDQELAPEPPQPPMWGGPSGPGLGL